MGWKVWPFCSFSFVAYEITKRITLADSKFSLFQVRIDNNIPESTWVENALGRSKQARDESVVVGDDE